LGGNIYILSVNMSILGPNMYILGGNMYILDISGPEDLLLVYP